jgi:hypothetical protein
MWCQQQLVVFVAVLPVVWFRAFLACASEGSGAVQGKADGHCYTVRVFHGTFSVEERMVCIACCMQMQVMLLVTSVC